MRLQSRCHPELLQSSKILIGTEEVTSKVAYSHGCLAEGLSSSPCGHLHTSLSILMIWHLASPRVGGPRERGRSHTIFYSLVSAHSDFRSSLPLFIGSKSLSTTHTRGGKELASTTWREYYQRICRRILKTLQQYYLHTYFFRYVHY